MSDSTGLLVGYKAVQGHGSKLSNFALDLSTLSDGSFGGGGGLSGLGSVLNGNSGGSSGSSSSPSLLGSLGSAGTMALSGAAVGGPIGAALGGAIGLITNIGNIFGGHGVPDHERPDLIKIAADNDITEEQASAVCGLEESKVKDNYDTICARAAGNKSYFQQLLTKYNQANPGNPIVPKTQQVQAQYTQLQAQVAQALAGTGVPSPLANLSLADAQQRAAATGMTLEAYLKAMLNGAAAQAQQAAQQATQQQATQQQATQAAAQQPGLLSSLGIGTKTTTTTAATGTAGVAGATGSTPEVEKDHTMLYAVSGFAAIILILLVVLVLKKKSQ